MHIGLGVLLVPCAALSFDIRERSLEEAVKRSGGDRSLASLRHQAWIQNNLNLHFIALHKGRDVASELNNFAGNVGSNNSGVLFDENAQFLDLPVNGVESGGLNLYDDFGGFGVGGHGDGHWDKVSAFLVQCESLLCSGKHFL